MRSVLFCMDVSCDFYRAGEGDLSIPSLDRLLFAAHAPLDRDQGSDMDQILRSCNGQKDFLDDNQRKTVASAFCPTMPVRGLSCSQLIPADPKIPKILPMSWPTSRIDTLTALGIPRRLLFVTTHELQATAHGPLTKLLIVRIKDNSHRVCQNVSGQRASLPTAAMNY